jgi:excisionase family DNA binding protein
MEDRHLSLSEVAGLMGVSERTVRRWIKAGNLKAYKPGRDYRIPESAVRELVEESEVYPKEARRWSLEPSFNDALEHERREDYIRKAREGLDQFCAYWEQRLASTTISRQEFEDLWETIGSWIPMLSLAALAEQDEIIRSGKRNHDPQLYGSGSELQSLSEIWEAEERFIRLGEALLEAEHEMYSDIEAEKRREQFRLLRGIAS